MLLVARCLALICTFAVLLAPAPSLAQTQASLFVDATRLFDPPFAFRTEHELGQLVTFSGTRQVTLFAIAYQADAPVTAVARFYGFGPGVNDVFNEPSTPLAATTASLLLLTLIGPPSHRRCAFPPPISPACDASGDASR
jgi:hypothetical protein